MKRWFGLPVAAIALTACVTINVYFPAAEAKEAAKEFVEKVIGDEAAQDEDAGGGDGGMAMLRQTPEELGARRDRPLSSLPPPTHPPELLECK